MLMAISMESPSRKSVELSGPSYVTPRNMLKRKDLHEVIVIEDDEGKQHRSKDVKHSQRKKPSSPISCVRTSAIAFSKLPNPQKPSTDSGSFSNRQRPTQTRSPFELQYSTWTFPPRTLQSSITSSSRTESTSLLTGVTRSDSPDTVQNVDDINDGLETINIDDDDDCPTLQEVSMPREYWDLTDECSENTNILGKTKNFHADDSMDSDEWDEWSTILRKERPVRTSRQLTESSRQMLVARSRWNGPIVPPLVLLEKLEHNGITLRPKVTVELQNGSFMRVMYLIQDVSTTEVFLRGWLFGRTKELNGWLEKKLNEVCMLIQADQDDERPQEGQSMENVSVKAVVRRRLLKITNQPFPNLSWRNNEEAGADVVKNERVLVCRWQFVRYYANATARLKDSPCEYAMLRLRKEECDPQYAVEDELLRHSWRGDTVKGGSYSSIERVRSDAATFSNHTTPIELIDPDVVLIERPIDLTNTDVPQLKPSNIGRRRHGQTYTFGDGFCGAGGTSRGATMAQLHVCWGFDMNEHACESWGLNWPSARIFQLMANDFAMHPTINALIDILHLSPPCQYFSPAHTTVGQDDERNTASSFATGNLLEKTKPRIVTIENTHGLLQRHGDYMSGTINQFTSKGFSIRWKILNFADYGLPQKRHRLVIIASCPGEVLPTFPPPTHSKLPEQTGLKPWTTINEAIEKIPEGTTMPNHDPESVPHFTDKPPIDGDTLSNTMTTSGGGYHPSGTRAYTHREWACIQGFPLDHKFGNRYVKHQIGNAVPPSVAKKLLGHIRQALLKVDGVVIQPKKVIMI